jgi:hypothetical protein
LGYERKNTITERSGGRKVQYRFKEEKRIWEIEGVKGKGERRNN